MGLLKWLPNGCKGVMAHISAVQAQVLPYPRTRTALHLVGRAQPDPTLTMHVMNDSAAAC